MGIELEPGQVAMRCNFVDRDPTGDDQLFGRQYHLAGVGGADHRPPRWPSRLQLAGRSGDGSTRRRHRALPGVSFRHILTVRDGAELLDTIVHRAPRHHRQAVAGSAPVGPGAALGQALWSVRKAILGRASGEPGAGARGRLPATQIWLFWPGMRPGEMPTFAETYAASAPPSPRQSTFCAGWLFRPGMDILRIPGVTDGATTTSGQMAAALRCSGRARRGVRSCGGSGRGGHAGDVAGKVRGDRAGGRADGAAGARPRG